MCGIAGIIQTGAPLYTMEDVKSMTSALAHRGPDGEGFWQSENNMVIFGHRRLAILDLTEKGSQPFHYQNRYTVVHNGEIYNYLELKEDLQKKGYNFFSETDTEVIAAAYACWGKECIRYFDGMFAFALWDEQENEFFAARDRFGEKPFFYYYDEEHATLLFASEMKGLWAAGIKQSPNLKMLFNFITIGYVENPESPSETFDSRLLKLPAAHCLTLSTSRKNSLTIEKYWEINAAEENKTIREEEAVAHFTFLLNDSIKKRLRSDVSIGTSLSGGLDSSSIVAGIGAHQSPHYHGHAFTASFPGFEKDEAGYAKLIADQYQLQQHIVELSVYDLLNDWKKLVYHQEVPFSSSSVYLQYKVFELAGKSGVKVLLDGQGADETLAGYHKYYKWYWQELFRNRKLYRSKELKAAKLNGITEKFDWKNMIAAYFPNFATVVLENKYLLHAIRQEDLNKEFVQQHSKEAYYTIPERFTLNSALHFNTCTHGLEELLRYADRNSMAHGREVRLPFLSHELVEFVFSLPAHFKIKNGWTKWLLRKTMESTLPSEITWRKDKVGFEPPQKLWMNDRKMQEVISESKRILVAGNILKKTALEKPIVPHGAYNADGYDWRYLSAATLFASI